MSCLSFPICASEISPVTLETCSDVDWSGSEGGFEAQFPLLLHHHIALIGASHLTRYGEPGNHDARDTIYGI